MGAFRRTRRQAGGPAVRRPPPLEFSAGILALRARSTTKRRLQSPTLPLAAIWGVTSGTSRQVSSMLEQGRCPPADVLVVAPGEVLDIPPPRSLAETRALMTRGIGLVVERGERHDPGLASFAESLVALWSLSGLPASCYGIRSAARGIKMPFSTLRGWKRGRYLMEPAPERSGDALFEHVAALRMTVEAANDNVAALRAHLDAIKRITGPRMTV